MNNGGSAEFLNQAPIRSPLPPKVRPRDGIGLSPAAPELLANSSLQCVHGSGSENDTVRVWGGFLLSRVVIEKVHRVVGTATVPVAGDV